MKTIQLARTSGFTLGKGTFNNIHGDLFVYQGEKPRRDNEDLHGLGERMRQRRPKEQQDGLKIIRNKHLNLASEIGRGPGYLFHAGKIKDRAVIVKVFSAERNAREHLEATVTVSQRLLHPNVLRIEGTSSPTSMHHFIAYENAHRKTAEGPLARALRDGLDKSIMLGFKMISDLSSGMYYLSTQGIALPRGPENFDVFLDIDDRFLFCINSPTDANTAHREQDMGSIWTLFSGLCQKVLRSANRLLHGY
ncbi:hypothetical protein FB45DRAFT_70272 [Roridomyces roridus]|uniref:Protein kinase domain-containing protein n=1 Tax=Roridomyces roridus TaxID=1738132 RepID=A0AAD7BMU8_9AGAR|nr:hypothetical protein FB45DRAFT_70272 [Roridomyces roridus]